ncbi:unnamed protein product [Blepharisma stoltei]|uniref:Kelch repeat-containing protein n=1 Tax=Blepharisma stoltei TaxID=1481888 RepID=A0AAU9JKC4_9CILI|nr:unnamed protein product [Blepharisma stoltei]
MTEAHKPLPLIEEEKSIFHSISDIPLYACTISTDSKEFLVYNIEDNKICAKIPNPVSFDMTTKGLLCKLNGSQLFYFGGRIQRKKTSGTCLLIDIKAQSVEILPSGRPRFFANPVYFENFVYIFGGSGGPNWDQAASDKFSLRKKKWKRIADLPIPTAQTSTVLFERKILIAGHKLGSILKYDHYKNSYKSLLEISPTSWKILFIFKERCYAVTNDLQCYVSEIKNWKIWNYHGIIDGIILS